MLGQWEAPIDNGGTFALGIAWELDQHVVVLHGKGGEMEFKGYSVLEPGGAEVKYFGFDNRGTVSKGVWGLEGDELTLNIESQTAERGTRKMAASFTGNATDGLKMSLYQVGDLGGRVSPAAMTLNFKKQK